MGATASNDADDDDDFEEDDTRSNASELGDSEYHDFSFHSLAKFHPNYIIGSNIAFSKHTCMFDGHHCSMSQRETICSHLRVGGCLFFLEYFKDRDAWATGRCQIHGCEKQTFSKGKSQKLTFAKMASHLLLMHGDMEFGCRLCGAMVKVSQLRSHNFNHAVQCFSSRNVRCKLQKCADLSFKSSRQYLAHVHSEHYPNLTDLNATHFVKVLSDSLKEWKSFVVFELLMQFRFSKASKPKKSGTVVA